MMQKSVRSPRIVHHNTWRKAITRYWQMYLLLIPVIAGVSFEFIRLAGKSENKIVVMLSKPGMMLQKLTTREPDASMAEVAIASVEAVFDWRAYLKENFDRPEQRKKTAGDGLDG